MNQQQNIFPFTAIVGQEDFKLALLLNIIEPSLGGVLAVGDKGTGKTTLIRSLAHLLTKEHYFPFVNLPIGVSEDRVLGHINLEKLINEKKEHLQSGLLAKAHQGCLYIDEINLLNDYLMDLLLDASSSGSYHLEREGISKEIESQFCLIGSMNPEEGDLRPQLKDRFGLSVNIQTSTSLKTREQIIENRISFDTNPILFLETYADDQEALLKKINRAKAKLNTIELDKACYTAAAQLALTHQVEGHRADILLIKAAKAYAAYLHESKVTATHIDQIAPFVLNHRSNNPPPSNSQENRQEQKEQNEQEKESSGVPPQNSFQSILPLNERQNASIGTPSKNGNTTHASNRTLKSQVTTNDKTVDKRKTVGQYLATNQFEIQHRHHENKEQRHLIFVVDASGSMLKDNVVAYAKGLVEKYSETETPFTSLYSLISLSEGTAELLYERTQNKEELLRQLKTLRTGGKTNIIPAFQQVKTLTQKTNNAENELILITDGKFNSGVGNPIDEAVIAYQIYCKGIQKLSVIDAERGTVKLQLAKQFATKLKASYEPLKVQHDDI